jgi:hypothetical protein
MQLLWWQVGPVYKICLCVTVWRCVNITCSATKIPVYAGGMMVVIMWHVHGQTKHSCSVVSLLVQ